MQNITSAAELKEAIAQLEQKQVVQFQLLKEQINLTYGSLKLVNLFKNSLNEIAASSSLLDSILNATVGFITGYISKKLVVGKSGNFLRNIIGTILQLGITNVIAKNSEAIKLMGQHILQRIFSKRETTS